MYEILYSAGVRKRAVQLEAQLLASLNTIFHVREKLEDRKHTFEKAYRSEAQARKRVSDLDLELAAMPHHQQIHAKRKRALEIYPRVEEIRAGLEKRVQEGQERVSTIIDQVLQNSRKMMCTQGLQRRPSHSSLGSFEVEDYEQKDSIPKTYKRPEKPNVIHETHLQQDSPQIIIEGAQSPRKVDTANGMSIESSQYLEVANHIQVQDQILNQMTQLCKTLNQQRDRLMDRQYEYKVQLSYCKDDTAAAGSHNCDRTEFDHRFLQGTLQLTQEMIETEEQLRAVCRQARDFGFLIPDHVHCSEPYDYVNGGYRESWEAALTDGVDHKRVEKWRKEVPEHLDESVSIRECDEWMVPSLDRGDGDGGSVIATDLKRILIDRYQDSCAQLEVDRQVLREIEEDSVRLHT